MRKLGIVIALTAAATLGSIGFAGTASAQGSLPIDDPVCTTLDSIADGSAENPQGPNGNNEPFDSTFAGAAKTCHESVANDQLRPSPLLCGITKGLTNAGFPDPPAGVPAEINDGAVDQGANDLPIWAFEKCGDSDDDDDDDGDGSNNPPAAGGGGAAVQGANAAADGGLPRTGGEL
ncbi:MAG TPA: hypothetical protein VI916_13285, partial [Acidimicrobiia bacterium]|nr:hypothetical protein [Acidimicrobiia bacterium]